MQKCRLTCLNVLILRQNVFLFNYFYICLIIHYNYCFCLNTNYLTSFSEFNDAFWQSAFYQSTLITFFILLCLSATRHCPPICPVGVKMDVDRPNSALLNWDPAPSSQTSTRSVFVLEMQEVGSQEWQKCFTSETATSAEVTGDIVRCEGNYRFRVCCINKYGRSGHVEFPKVAHLGEEHTATDFTYRYIKCHFFKVLLETLLWGEYNFIQKHYSLL